MAKANTKRISGQGGLRDLVSELEDVLTPAIVRDLGAPDDVLTGNYHIDTDTSTKITTITFYAKTKQKAPRKQTARGFLEVVEDSILDVGWKGFEIETEFHDSISAFTTGALDVIISSQERNKKVIKHKIRYGIKPAADAREGLYAVTAQECLQVLGCAYLQATGSIDENDFTNFLNYMSMVADGAEANVEKYNRAAAHIQQHVNYGIGRSEIKDIYTFGIGDSDWVTSTVTTAKILSGLYNGGNYFFCHSGAKEVDWMWDAFKRARGQVLKNKDVFAGIGPGDLDRNKWNPADIFAMKMNEKSGYKFPALSDARQKETNAISESELKKELKARGRAKSATINIGQQIEKNAESASTVEGMPSLNLFIYNLAQAKKFFPISLKKVGSSANLEFINPGIGIPVQMTAELKHIDWASDTKPTNKIEVHFAMKTGSSSKDYYINARQFNEGADIKFQIEKTGGMAFHGKAGLKIGTTIINQTDPGMKAEVNKVRTNIKKDYKSFVKSNSLFSSTGDITSTYRKGVNGLSSLNAYAKVLSSGNITKIHQTATGYISKIQAAEFGYIIDSGKESGVTSNILYSLYSYAGSRGLVLFNKGEYKNYYSSSFHVKVL